MVCLVFTLVSIFFICSYSFLLFRDGHQFIVIGSGDFVAKRHSCKMKNHVMVVMLQGHRGLAISFLIQHHPNFEWSLKDCLYLDF